MPPQNAAPRKKMRISLFEDALLAELVSLVQCNSPQVRRRRRAAIFGNSRHSGQEGLAITATDSRLVVQHELTGFQVRSNVLSNALSGALLNVQSNIPSDVPSNALSNDLSNDLSNVLVNCFIECMAY